MTTEDLQRLKKKFKSNAEFLRHYGLLPRSTQLAAGRNSDLPIGMTYSADRKSIHFNCFLCHAGLVNGEPYEGAPNTKLRFQELIDDLKLSDLNSHIYKLGGGTFGIKAMPGSTSANEIASLAVRSRNKGKVSRIELVKNLFSSENIKAVPVYPPPWWELRPGLRETLYADGSKDINHGHIMQFAATSEKDLTQLAMWSDKFKEVLGCIRDTPLPRPKGIFDEKTELGKRIYFGETFPKNQDCNCVKCHGSMDSRNRWDYRELRVPMSKLKTDETYFTQRTPEYERKLNEFLIGVGASPQTEEETPKKNYMVAPPLTALYTRSALLHNKSVPTLKDLLCTPESERPARWRSLKTTPNVADYGSVDRNPTEDSFQNPIFDTNLRGASNSGHDFCTSELKRDPEKCSQLIQYLDQL